MTSATIANRTFAEIEIGESAELDRTLTKEDVDFFAAASGDVNPTHVDQAYVEEHSLGRLTGHSMWSGSLISSVLGNILPGPGTIYRSQVLRFHRPVKLGDTITTRVIARDKQPETKTVWFDCECRNQDNDLIVTGTAEVTAPTEKIVRPKVELPGLVHPPHDSYGALIARCEGLEPLRTAIAHPCDRVSLSGAVDAARADIIIPLLVGPTAKIQRVAEENDIDISGFEIVDVPHSHAAAAQAVALVRAGEADLLMKGSLHTDEIMGEVVRSSTGLRTERRLSHAFVMDVPTYPKILIISDAAINIAPDLEDKRDICQNAVDLAHAFDLERPKVAILSAVETVRAKIPSTVEAAALCKMAERGQISGAVIDGPLAMDNAISKAAAITKGIQSEVAGDADILLAPDLEAGNILVKQLMFLANAEGAGIVLGAKVPIVLTSRADSPPVRMASCAVAVLFAHYQRGSLGIVE